MRTIERTEAVEIENGCPRPVWRCVEGPRYKIISDQLENAFAHSSSVLWFWFERAHIFIDDTAKLSVRFPW